MARKEDIKQFEAFMREQGISPERMYKDSHGRYKDGAIALMFDAYMRGKS